MEKSSDDLAAPFLESSPQGGDLDLKSYNHRRGGLRSSWIKINAMSLMTMILLLYIAIIETIRFKTSPVFMPASFRNDRKEERVSLVDDILHYEERDSWVPLEDPWNEPPSPKLDDLWSDFLWALNIRIKPEEVKYLGLNTTNRIQVNGGDYLGVIGAYHHLHCLGNLRVAIHWDDYYAEKYRDRKDLSVFSKAHSDHCLDTIRQALMCHAQTEIHLAEWVEHEDARPDKELSYQSPSTCLVWKTLDDWVRPRALRAGEYTYRPGPFET